MTRIDVRTVALAAALVFPCLPVAAEESRQPREDRTPRLNQLASPQPAAAPTIGDPALSVDGEIHLSGTTSLFKNSALFLWDDASTLALGRGALDANSTGMGNLAIGYEALTNNTTGNRNTAVGFQALRSDPSYPIGDDNTAFGYKALYANEGYNDGVYPDAEEYGYRNTAAGSYALTANTRGNDNTAIGNQALMSNTEGEQNTAVGNQALMYLTTGEKNTALGEDALRVLEDGDFNVAVGENALLNLSSGVYNVAVGQLALAASVSGSNNTALGYGALIGVNAAHGDNIGIGYRAGESAIYGDNILIGHSGVAMDANTIRLGNGTDHTKTYIAGIYPVTGDGTHYALVDSTGQVSRGGAIASSARFKGAIRAMGETSRGLLALRPVTFRSELPAHRGEKRDFGLIAEEVAEVFPELVLYDAQGQPHGVRYNVLSSLLVNEVQRLHRQSRLQWSLLGLVSIACLVALRRRRPA